MAGIKSFLSPLTTLVPICIISVNLHLVSYLASRFSINDNIENHNNSGSELQKLINWIHHQNFIHLEEFALLLQ